MYKIEIKGNLIVISKEQQIDLYYNSQSLGYVSIFNIIINNIKGIIMTKIKNDGSLITLTSSNSDENQETNKYSYELCV
jgi:hypothetical protein